MSAPTPHSWSATPPKRLPETSPTSMPAITSLHKAADDHSLEGTAMQTVVNKTFDEIAAGDAASVERTLQAGDLRAWAAAFGEGDMLAGPGESQAAAGIVTSMLTALAGSALPGPGSSIRTASVQIKGSLPIATAMTARLIVRERRPDQGIVVLDG